MREDRRMKLLRRRRRSRADRLGRKIVEVVTFVRFAGLLGRWWWRTSRRAHRLSLHRS
jgi:hypothetical protein